MQDISGFGLRVTIKASVTFPQGFTITQFADDADPLDMTAIALAEAAMGLNGDLIVWSKATPLPAVLNVVPNGDDDRNLSILAEANRVGKGKRSAKDKITAVINYPDGSTTTLTTGGIISAISGRPISSSGRMKSKPYAFAFENKVDSVDITGGVLGTLLG